MKRSDITLKTGVEITFDKNGNIKHLTSPYYTKKDNPTRGTTLRWLVYKLKQII